jgi:16S rRNA (cytosine1402-N4)-methyltransferase
MAPHTAVLMHEVLAVFKDKSISLFIDGTLGAAGHAEALLQAHPEIDLFIGIDQDPTALTIAQERLAPWKEKVRLIQSNFSHLSEIIAQEGQGLSFDGLMLDLGVSSMQLDRAEKGFSFMREGPLDMRMDPNADLTASEVINQCSEQELGRIFRTLGEEKQWRQAARVIVAARNQKPILTTQELTAVLKPIFFWKKKGINPLTLIFQALRIYVNRELEVLEQTIPQAIALLASGGRFAVISFHSLEDRIVKEHFRSAASDKVNTEGIGGLFLDKEPEGILLTRKPLIPSDDEVANNPRSRSAKMRVLEKI